MSISQHEKHELEQKLKVQESHLLKEQKEKSQIKGRKDVYYNAKEKMEITVRDLSVSFTLFLLVCLQPFVSH